MQFNSFAFILVCFPVLVCGYFLLNRYSQTAGKVFLTAGGAAFYIYGNSAAAVLAFSGSIAFNYLLSAWIARAAKHRKALMAAGTAANIALLFYFKYYNFFFATIYDVLHWKYALREIVQPLAISFFTFQQIMYVVNVYRGEIRQVDLLDYLAYILYFPKLQMGPLAEPKDLIAQLNDGQRKRFDWDHLACGLRLFSYGLFKKLVLADTFAGAVAWAFADTGSRTSMDCILAMLSYTFEIYFDFSGYSDMAVGISHILNIDLPQNFDSPYMALSIRDFWKRWHITLTGFLTRYIYIPLGGSRKGQIRTCINIMAVFLISGLWHGANMTFVLWGLLHGACSVAERLFAKAINKLSAVVRWFVTFFTVNVLWLLFRADSVTVWLSLLKTIFKFQDMSVSQGLLQCFVLPETPFLLKLFHLEHFDMTIRGFSLLVFMLAAFAICLIPQNNYKTLKKTNWANMALAALAFVWSFLCLGTESVFVYFNF